MVRQQALGVSLPYITSPVLATFAEASPSSASTDPPWPRPFLHNSAVPSYARRLGARARQAVVAGDESGVDVLLVDDAERLSEACLLTILAHCRPRLVVVAADSRRPLPPLASGALPRALPRLVRAAAAAAAAGGQATREEGGVAVSVMKCQYRSHPAISAAAAALFYHTEGGEEGVLDGVCEDSMPPVCWLPPISVFDTGDGDSPPDGTARLELEAASVAGLIASLVRQGGQRVKGMSTGGKGEEWSGVVPSRIGCQRPVFCCDPSCLRVCVCVFVCVSQREKEREKANAGREESMCVRELGQAHVHVGILTCIYACRGRLRIPCADRSYPLGH